MAPHPAAAALNRRLREAARERARAALVGTSGGAAAARVVSAGTADNGGVRMQTADGLIGHLRGAGLLTPRQLDAAAELARLWGRGGHRSPWHRGDGGERDPEGEERARAQYRLLVAAAPVRCHGALDLLSMGEWPMREADPVGTWREGLDAVADALRLAI